VNLHRKPEVSGLRSCSKLLLELSSPAYIKERTRRPTIQFAIMGRDSQSDEASDDWNED
ncbi:hypothetical protein L9F63_004538, partial [Diploptera punctata]